MNYPKYIKASCFESELSDTSIKDKLDDAISEYIENKSVGHNSIARNSKVFIDREVDRRKKWKRIPGVRKLVEGEVNLEANSTRDGDIEEEDVCIKNGDDAVGDELDVNVYGIKPDSSLGCCNVVLKRLERCSDSRALKFFIWMRSNGKLKGNVTAHNLVLRVLGRRGDWTAAERLIEQMKLESGCELECRVFNTIIFACSKRGLVDVGAKWFHLMLEYKVQPNVATWYVNESLPEGLEC
ncbi:hypothetical protein Ancab_027675 [Ancistrocladus abbreviatus]